MVRHDNGGLRKLCACPHRNWPTCTHDWYFNFKPRGGKPWRFSLDVEHGQRIKSKGEAEIMADRIRTEIRAGTFVRAADKRKAAAIAPALPESVTLAASVPIYLERVSQVRERNKSWKNDRCMVAQIVGFILPDVHAWATTPSAPSPRTTSRPCTSLSTRARSSADRAPAS